MFYALNVYLLYHSEDGIVEADGPTELMIDLTYLSPLWKLYKSMAEEQGPEQTPPLLRALTELFFSAENVAMVRV